jgi:hypothetical protein
MTYPQWLLDDFRNHLGKISVKLAEILCPELASSSSSERCEHGSESALIEPDQPAHRADIEKSQQEALAQNPQFGVQRPVQIEIELLELTQAEDLEP